MIRSMFSAVAGLRGHQTMLDVIGNNIANVNTSAFKSSRVLFSDLYYQTTTAASAPTNTSGGQNPTQIGYGSLVSRIDVDTSRAGFQQTSRPMDAYIAGEGYFAVRNGTDDYSYTRVGALSFDVNGTLLDAEGNYVLGGMPTLTGNAPAPIMVAGFENYTNISISDNGTILGTNTASMQVETLAQIAIAVFENPAGLLQEGQSHYVETPNSGAPIFLEAGTGKAGSLVAGGIEMSNVDLANEFSNMIIAQRGFQANARVITTSDSVLEELVNLKR